MKKVGQTEKSRRPFRTKWRSRMGALKGFQTTNVQITVRWVHIRTRHLEHRCNGIGAENVAGRGSPKASNMAKYRE